MYQANIILFLKLLLASVCRCDSSAITAENQNSILKHDAVCQEEATWNDCFILTFEQRKQCCAENYILHCQEKEDGQIVRACLPTSTCEAGTFFEIQTRTEGNDTYASGDCKPCSQAITGDVFFQSENENSHNFKYAHCLRSRTLCNRTGQEKVYNGTDSEDALCRCRREDGYRPINNTTRCKSGFTDDDTCSCVLGNCSDGTELDEGYECVPTKTTTDISEGRDPKTVTEKGRNRSTRRPVWYQNSAWLVASAPGGVATHGQWISIVVGLLLSEYFKL